MFSTSKFLVNPPSTVVTDPYFNYTALLLNDTGTNGAQNNTFIAANYAAASALGGYAGYFDGSGDYLDAPNNTVFDFGSSNFTIECWIFVTSSNQGTIIERRGTTFTTGDWTLYVNESSGIVSFYAYDINTAFAVVSGSGLILNTWNHVAVVRNGNSFNLYLNGTSISSSTSSASFANNSLGLTIGRNNNSGGRLYFTGYISNLRVVKGTAVYTSNFTVPTTPLTAISGTSLLTCQSATFVDNSPNNFTITVNGNAVVSTASNSGMVITRNGNTTQGSFNPYMPTGYWGGYFDGSGYLVNSSSSSTLGMGTSDFTMEAWLYYRGNAGGYNFAPIFTLRTNTTGTLSSGDTDGLYFDAVTTSAGIKISGTTTSIGSGTAMPTNTWTHLALTRQSGTVKLFVNGVQSGSSVSISGNMLANYIQIGCDGFGSIKGLLVGYVSNLRFVKGTAVYTSNFTVPTTPLTAITNTSLLCLQDNRFKDNSSNNFTFSVTGTPKTTGFNPFAPTASYTTSAYGGSAYFDGAGTTTTLDNVYTPESSALDLIDGSNTVECWIYQTGRSAGALPLGAATIFGMRASSLSGGAKYYALQISTTGYLSIGKDNNGSASNVSTTLIPLNAWTHIAWVRTGGANKFYVNGADVTATFSNPNMSGWPLPTANYACYVGVSPYVFSSYTYLYPFNGYISNFRVVKGTAVYTAAFTPPTAPVTAITNTSLLLNATNAGIYDATTLSDLETVGSAQVSTAQAKWGASSMFFNGTTDNLYIGKDTELDMGSGNFTIEWWMYPTTTTQKNTACIIASGNATWGTGAIVIDCGAVTSNKVRFVANPNGTAVIDPNPWTVNTWTYFAFVRNGNTLTLYRNGTSVASNGSFNTFVSTVNLNYNNATKIGGGSWDGANSYFTGYIEDLRITKGIARYTANFTPPTAAFPTR